MTGKTLPSQGGSYVRKPRGGLERQPEPAPAELNPDVPADDAAPARDKETK